MTNDTTQPTPDEQRDDDQQRSESTDGGQVSEGAGAFGGADSAIAGADAVPDYTSDVNQQVGGAEQP